MTTTSESVCRLANASWVSSFYKLELRMKTAQTTKCFICDMMCTYLLANGTPGLSVSTILLSISMRFPLSALEFRTSIPK